MPGLVIRSLRVKNLNERVNTILKGQQSLKQGQVKHSNEKHCVSGLMSVGIII